MLKPTDARTASTFTKALALSASVAAITLAAGSLYAAPSLAQDASSPASAVRCKPPSAKRSVPPI